MQFKEIDFSKYSSIKIGPKVEVAIVEDIKEIKKDAFLIGGANNLLISNNPPPLMVLGKSFDYIKIDGDFLIVGAAVKTGRLLSFVKKNSIANFEFIAKLPGTIGGMVAMNAGVKEYEVFNILQEIKIDGKWVKKEDIEYGYRYAKLGGIATDIKFKLEGGYKENLRLQLIKLRENQPKEPSAGSFFKNPPNDYAGRLIEAVGLKGKRVGNMAWSSKHANFLVNLGGGTFDEAIELVNLAKEKVFDKFKIELKEEVKVI